MTVRRAVSCGLGVGVLCALAAPPARADAVDSLVASGPVTNRLNVAVLGDGYTSSASDQAKLAADARTVINGLLSFGPYQSYRGLFNIKLVHTISPSATIPKGGVGGQTALGCYFGCGGIDRLVCCDTGVEGSVASVTAANVPEATLSIVVVNDETFGGSGGSFTVISTNTASVEILLHEFGHTLATLADEYTFPNPGYPPCDVVEDCVEPNATLYARRPGKWGQWVDNTECVPTLDRTRGVGYFEGCRYQETGVFKPVSNPVCLMNALGKPFCPVCAEAVSLALWSRATPVDSVTPPTTSPVATAGCAVQSFTVAVPANAGQLELAWSIDGVRQADATTAIGTFDTNKVAPGTHTVVATVHDATPAIRADPHHLTTVSETWTWQTACATGQAPDAVPIDAGQVVDAAPAGNPASCGVTDMPDAGDAMPPTDSSSGGCCEASRRGGLAGTLVAVAIAIAPLVRRRHRRQ